MSLMLEIPYILSFILVLLDHSGEVTLLYFNASKIYEASKKTLI